MFHLIVAAAALAAPVPDTVPGAALPIDLANRECATARTRHAVQSDAVFRGEAVRPRRLDELPPGRLELTVYRSVDGCAIPAVLRENVEEPARR